MKRQISIKFLTLFLTITIILSACTTIMVNNNEVQTPTPEVSTELPNNENKELNSSVSNPEAEPEVNTPEQLVPTVDPSELPTTKELEFLLEGMTEKVEATLTISEQGYSFYLMNNFDFASKEPGKDIIFNETFPDYFATIELLPTDINIIDIKEHKIEQLNKLGNVVELKVDEIKSLLHKDANFFLFSSNDHLHQSNILLDDGIGFFLISLTLPTGEANEGITQRFYPMIQSLVSTK